MFSFIGEAIDFREGVRSILSSPNQNYLVEVPANGLLSLWVESQSGFRQVDLPADVSLTDRVAASPLGFSLAVVSTQRALVQIFSTLPNNPVLAFSVSFADLGGAPKTLAISDDGNTLLFSLGNGDQDWLYAFQLGRQPQFVSAAASISSVAFGTTSRDAVLTDFGGNRVYLLHNLNGFFSPVLLADESAGISGPTAAAFSRDGQRVIVADSQSSSVEALALDGTLASSTPCAAVPRLLDRMIGNAVFRISDFDGSSVAVFDADSDLAVTFLIGALSQATSDAPDTRSLPRAGTNRR